jgi:hypothetical protein
MMINQCHPNNTREHNQKMPIPPPKKQQTAHGTYQHFAEPNILETFMRDYRRILMEKFQKVIIEGDLEYWSCGL